uniref:DNA-directed RNA polymerase n=1 Tax=viral metagenome TaxID=1070528 RepID=A0A6C0DRD5_9ZZZZ
MSTKESSDSSTELSRSLLRTYFETFKYPFVRHHIDSYDQFLTEDLPAILQANNPILILKELIPNTTNYMYRVELFVGGPSGTEIEIGTPTLHLQKGNEVRVLFPNEARLRNLTYSATVVANIHLQITITDPSSPSPVDPVTGAPVGPYVRVFPRVPLFQIPILLHSRFCLLHGKPAAFLQEAGECIQDQGGYFIIGGSEKVLISRQEQAFNTLYLRKQLKHPKVSTYGNITCLSPKTREVKIVTFEWVNKTESLVVTLPFVRVPIPIFVLFRAFGVTSEEDILRLIYPDLEGSEARQMIPLLVPSIGQAYPFVDTVSAIQFIKAMTKGFSVSHVYDILYNKVFIHITDIHGGNRVHFLADCVRKFMRVHVGIDQKTDRDDTRNQRCLTSGVLIRMLFTNAYTAWKKAVRREVDLEYEYNTDMYRGQKFINIFSEGNTTKLFRYNLITDMLMRGFKGKWVTGGAGGGGVLGHSDEKTGVLQALSRISYLDFMSHLRRVVLNYTSAVALIPPHQLHGSQYGYYCTSETPGGKSIGITKNLSLMTLLSTATDPAPIERFLIERAWVLPCSEMRPDLQQLGVPCYINNGIVGYTLQPFELTEVLKLMKWTGCLPAFASITFNVRDRRVSLFTDEGRPCRPLVHLEHTKDVTTSMPVLTKKSWRDLVLGSFSDAAGKDITTPGFFDPMSNQPGPIPLTTYKDSLEPYKGVIEYIDPYEQNEAFIVHFPEHINKETSHVEIHPSTIVSIVTSMIPFANFNQSPRNQLSCSQSKQGLSLYATNFQNRYDNAANILCYGEAPLVRTLVYDILGDGMMPYGANIIMAIMPFGGYNQDDGIVFNGDAFQRGLFRNINYRSYDTYEADEKETRTTSVIAHPSSVPEWTHLHVGFDYSKLDERGLIRVGEWVTSKTVLVGRYVMRLGEKDSIQDASLTPQVWTSGRVESVLVTVNAQGKRLVKVRITQDRTPELGDKFSTRHGQKGTIGMIYRAHDMPRTKDGLVPDMIVNPHCIPSRMTIAQLMEMLFGKVCWEHTMVGDATLFMSDKGAVEQIGTILEKQFGLEKTGNELLYDGASGVQMPTTIFMGPVFGMRLKHMTEDKWNARGEGRREQRTHQPTGGRGAEGGLRIGEMERDALIAHGISGFARESIMERSDRTEFRICNGCGTIPIFNQRQNLFVCPMCDGPVKFIGSTAQTLELLPTLGKSQATTSVVEMPYATKLLGEELQTYLNMGVRFLTAKGVAHLKDPPMLDTDSIPSDEAIQLALRQPLPERILPETRVPEYREYVDVSKDLPPEVRDEDLVAMGVLLPKTEEESMEEEEQEAAAAVAGPVASVPSGPVGITTSTSYFTPQPQPQPQPQFIQQGGMAYPMVPMSPMQATQMPPMQGSQMPPMQGSQMSPYGMQQGMVQQTMGQGQMQYPMISYPMQTPMQGGAPMQGSQMPPMYYGQPYTMQQQEILPSPVPNGPPTIVIDTSPQAMAYSGFMEDQQTAARGGVVMGASRRNTTPRNRGISPNARSRGPPTVSGKSYESGMKVTIKKI